MTARRLLRLGLVVLAGSLIPSAAGGGAAGGGGDDPPQSPPTPPPLGRFLALTAATAQTVFKPTDDAYTSASNPNTTHGTSTSLRVDADPIRRSYVRFVVAGVTDRITRVTLRLQARTTHSTGYDVRTITDNRWSEKTITYRNAPAASTAVAGTSGALTAGAWKSIDVTGIVAGNGTYSFALTNASSSSLELSSKEAGSGKAPQLVVQTVANSAPLAISDAAVVSEDGSLSVPASTLLANDSDPDGDLLQVSSVGSSPDTHGAVTLSGQTVEYVPAADFAGPASFTYAVSDGRGGTSSAVVTVDVAAVNDTPTAVADEGSTNEDSSVLIPFATLLANDGDVDGDALQVSSVMPRPDTNGRLALEADGITYSPSPDFNGTASLDYEVRDASGASATGVVTITVSAVNDAPTCANTELSTAQGVAVAAEGLCSDVDGEALAYSLPTAPAYGTVTLTGSGGSYLPALAATHGTSRDDSFVLRAADGAGETASAAVSVRVTPRPGDLELPTRAAFYYPWFPAAWKQQGYDPFTRYTPTFEPSFYSSSDADVVRAHVRALDYGNFDVGIASWWGPGQKFESERIPLLLNATAELGSDLKWTLYYEAEGRGNPSVEALQADFAYIHTNYANHPNYARVDGKPVLFVYSVDDLTCELTSRWAQATAGEWYVVLNVFPGFANCPVQPDAWHQYGPAQAARARLPHSYNVSPGFWRPDEAAPRLARDLTRFDQNIRDMIGSGARWQLVTSFNEWGEGTPVENAQQWLSPSGYGEYLDVLHAYP